MGLSNPRSTRFLTFSTCVYLMHCRVQVKTALQQAKGRQQKRQHRNVSLPLAIAAAQACMEHGWVSEPCAPAACAVPKVQCACLSQHLNAWSCMTTISPRCVNHHQAIANFIHNIDLLGNWNLVRFFAIELRASIINQITWIHLFCSFILF